MTETRSEGVQAAVVLCAGGGSRLGDLTETIPKTLLDVGGGRTILDQALGALAKAGTTRVALVVGHAADTIQASVPDLEERHSLRLTLVTNPNHASRNNAYSLALGLAGFGEDVYVVNGDTLFEVDVLDRLASATPAPVTLAVDRIKTLGVEEMKVTFDANGSLASIAKGLDSAEADGEFIGLSLVSRTAISRVVDALNAAWTRDATLYYEDAFGDLAAAGFAVGMVDVGDLPWIEIDTPADLERARTMAWH